MDSNNQDLQKNVGEAEEDRISELPDSILHYILSFLDTKYVARTCVLSKRWKHIWISIPTLDFLYWDLSDSPSLSKINKFMDFVDRTLLLHHPLNIQKFTLSLYRKMNASWVHSWIEYLTSRHVEELDLHVYFGQDIPLSIPVSLFTCESLTKLELSDGPSVRFPNRIFFPKLKSLTLSRIQFGDNGCCNDQPFSNCLVLEELILDNCNWFGTRKFYILTPVLKILEIYNEFESEGTLEDCDLKIHAPSLVSLKCQGCVAKDYDMSNFLTLDNAEIEFFIFDDELGRGEQKITQSVNKCVRALSHVRCLSLNVNSEPVLFVADDFVSNLPAFHNLNELKLYDGGATTDKVIFAMLTATPNLKCLELGWLDHSCDEDEEYDETNDLFRHLQSVRFARYSRRRRELRWVKLILKNAKSLQTMTIAFDYLYSNTITPKSKEVVMLELLSFTRASWRCGVKFV